MTLLKLKEIEFKTGEVGKANLFYIARTSADYENRGSNDTHDGVVIAVMFG